MQERELSVKLETINLILVDDNKHSFAISFIRHVVIRNLNDLFFFE